MANSVRTPDPRARLAGVACLALGVAHLVHALWWGFLCDDAYISFRYVQNALAGRGLVFNPGEFVEGYSNLLWVLQLVALGWVGIGPEDGALLLGVMYSAGTLALAAALTRELCHRRHAWPCVVATLAMLAANRSFAIWTTGGLETRSNTFFLLAGALGAVRALRGLGGAAWGGAAFALACLTRPDSPAMAAVAVAFLLAGRRWRDAVVVALPVALAVAGQMLWRRWYYGDWLPNTYYAKVGAPWWDVGARYLASAMIEHGLWLVLPLCAWWAWRSRRPGTRMAAAMLLAMIAAQALYQARIGGDHFEFRPLDLAWPLVAAMTAAALARVWYGGARRWRAPLVGAAAALLLVYANAIPWLSARAESAVRERREATLRAVPLETADLGLWRFVPGMGPLARAWNSLTASTIRHAVGVRHFEHRINADYLIGLYAGFEGLKERGLLPADTTMATGAVGIVAYFTDFRIVDLYGLTDRTIARTPRTGGTRLMAHDRMAPPGYLESRGVNIERPFLWQSPPESMEGLEDLFFVQLDERRVMSFRAPDPEWARRSFQGRILREPAEAAP